MATADIQSQAGCESPRPAISLAMQPTANQPTAKQSRLSQPNREIAGKELVPQPSGNEREANSDGRKEAMCAVVQSIVIIAQR